MSSVGRHVQPRHHLLRDVERFRTLNLYANPVQIRVRMCAPQDTGMERMVRLQDLRSTGKVLVSQLRIAATTFFDPKDASHVHVGHLPETFRRVRKRRGAHRGGRRGARHHRSALAARPDEPSVGIATPAERQDPDGDRGRLHSSGLLLPPVLFRQVCLHLATIECI